MWGRRRGRRIAARLRVCTLDIGVSNRAYTRPALVSDRVVVCFGPQPTRSVVRDLSSRKLNEKISSTLPFHAEQQPYAMGLLV